MNPFVRSPTSEAKACSSAEHARGWLDPWFDLIANRCELIGIETRAAARNILVHLILALAAIALFLFGWALAIGGAIVMAATGMDWPWPVCALAVAALHVAAAGLIVLRLKRMRHRPMFSHTRAEFRKDRAWIETLQKKPGS
jgi:uncharacterized membrane protein YqjE